MSNRRFRTQAEQNAYDLGRRDAAPGEPLTLDQIKGMSTEEVADRLDEVNAVLAQPVAGGGDNAES